MDSKGPGIEPDHTVYYCIFTVHSQYLLRRKIMITCKPTTLTFRIKPILKEALRTAAALEHRSISNMVEVLIRNYCEQNGISIRELDDLIVNQESGKV